MTKRHQGDVETRYRTLRRQQRASTIRLVLLVVGITAAAIWWMAENLRS